LALIEGAALQLSSNPASKIDTISKTKKLEECWASGGLLLVTMACYKSLIFAQLPVAWFLS
jgi:hypothetical protein